MRTVSARAPAKINLALHVGPLGADGFHDVATTYQAVSLDEMDRVLRAVPQVRDAACVAVPHRFLGEEVVAAVALASAATEQELRAVLAAVFAPAVLPSRIEYLDAIPRTATGKIRRPELAGLLTAQGR